MKLNDHDLLELSELAQTLARKTGELIQDYSQKKFDIFHKKAGDTQASQVVTEVDHACEALILDGLKSSIEKYDLAVLSEEREDDKFRLKKDYFWCIDPMDGTLAFTEAKPGYAVSIALVSKAGEALIGVVFDPLKNTIYSAIKGHGATKNNSEMQLSKPKAKDYLTLPCDRSFMMRPDVEAIRNKLQSWAIKEGYSGIKEIHHGGAVMNALWVLENPPACYFKLPKPQEGGGSLWDFAATACILNELDIHVCNFSGNALELNRKDSTFMNHRGAIYATDSNMLSFITSLST